MILSKLPFSFGIILSGFLLGYAIQVLAARGLICLPVSLDALRKGLQRAALLFINPVALEAARLLALPPKKTGALFYCGSFTNIGSLGALVCYMFLGEPGFALVPIYKIFEELSYYSTGFPIAKYYSGSTLAERSWDRVKGLAREPLIIVSVSSLVLGGALNLSGLKRPVIYGTVNAVFIPLGAFINQEYSLIGLYTSERHL
jgi:hypothetical protein